MLSVVVGLVLTVVGYLLVVSYGQESVMNYTGFGMLLVGLAVLSLGISGTIAAILKNRIYLNTKYLNPVKSRLILGSIWATGVGAILIINGFLIASFLRKHNDELCRFWYVACRHRRFCLWII